MGWTSIETMRTGFENKERLDSFVKREVLNNEYEVLASNYSKIDNKYIYYSATRKRNRSPIFGLVVTLEFSKGEVFWKEEDETQGPIHRNASKEVLDLLTPTVYKFANNWREECKRNL